jgi:hypothetical protein
MWDRRWWWGLPRYILARFIGRTRYRRLRPSRVPGGDAVREAILQAADTGAGAIYVCLKPHRPEEIPPEAMDPEWTPE